MPAQFGSVCVWSINLKSSQATKFASGCAVQTMKILIVAILFALTIVHRSFALPSTRLSFTPSTRRLSYSDLIASNDVSSQIQRIRGGSDFNDRQSYDNYEDGYDEQQYSAQVREKAVDAKEALFTEALHSTLHNNNTTHTNANSSLSYSTSVLPVHLSPTHKLPSNLSRLQGLYLLSLFPPNVALRPPL